MNEARGYAKAILSNYHALIERQYVGDIDAIITLVDLEAAIDRAGLTDRQLEALRLVYDEDLTQADAGKRMGVGQDVVSTHLSAAIKKLDEIYEYDAWHDAILKEVYDEFTNGARRNN